MDILQLSVTQEQKLWYDNPGMYIADTTEMEQKNLVLRISHSG